MAQPKMDHPSSSGASPRPVYAAARPPNEEGRLRALASYQILDSALEPAYDDLTRLASIICETPIAVVNLIDRDRQWFKSEVGLDTRELPLEASICAHAILQPGLTEIPDTLQDERLSCNPLVYGTPNLRFYAGALLRTPDGHALGTLCVLDYTPRKLSDRQREALTTLARQVMAQMELRKSLHTATRAMGYRAQLMAIAGHDLRQPMQVVSMTLGALARNLPANHQAALDRANRALLTLSHDLDRLAASSKLGQPDLIDLETIQLRPVMLAVAENWALHAAQKGLHIHVVACKRSVCSNASMLATMLGNLVGNAIKYSDHGKVVIGCRRQGDLLSLQVWDSGRGISAEQLKSIFVPFTQIDRASEGLGLGLSIVAETAQLLGHTVSVTSTPGAGSCFSIQLKLESN